MMSKEEMEALRESQLFALKTLIASAESKLGAGLRNIIGHTTTGRITDSTGCPLDFQEQAELLIVVRALVRNAGKLADELWDAANEEDDK